MDRGVCEHAVPLALKCEQCATPDPKSVAGVLLREHDTAAQALAYAKRKARSLAALGSGIACDYLEAVRQLEAVTCASCGLHIGSRAHRYICQ